jgi:hypothetical protein
MPNNTINCCSRIVGAYFSTQGRALFCMFLSVSINNMGTSIFFAISLDEIADIGVCIFAVVLGLLSMNIWEFGFALKLLMVLGGIWGIYISWNKWFKIYDLRTDYEDAEDQVDEQVEPITEFADLVEPETKEIIPPADVEEK